MIDDSTLAESDPEEYVDLVTRERLFCAKNGIFPWNFGVLGRFWDFFAKRSELDRIRSNCRFAPVFLLVMAFVATV